MVILFPPNQFAFWENEFGSEEQLGSLVAFMMTFSANVAGHLNWVFFNKKKIAKLILGDPIGKLFDAFATRTHAAETVLILMFSTLV
ncbi:hypothetical protein GCM10009119_21390 [Algoriphagus jejuensis]|uniref:Uncharacterized protein n=1 Tax=Algoriphagus jejuensis TaxID=419934 RepID=A0ABP3YES4_9BACT